MRFLLIISFFLFCFFEANAQYGELKGNVYINKKELLIGAVVSIVGSQKQAITDSMGRFHFTRLKYGHYRLSVRSMEIIGKQVEVNLNQALLAINVFTKESRAHSLKEVSIQGMNKKKRIETGGYSVAIIDTKEPALRNVSTNELLDRTVGVRVRQNGGIGAAVEYNLNGMSGNAIGIFIDGIEASTYGQSFNLNNIPPALIERIEVYKGVLPPHLTGDYVGGAINVVMKKEVDKNNITLASSVGSFGTYQSDLVASVRNSRTGLTGRLSAFHIDTDNSFKTWGHSTTYVNEYQQITRNYRATRFNDKYQSVGARMELGYTKVKWADLFLLGYNGSYNYNEIPHGVTMATPYVGRFNRTKAHVFSANYQKNDFLFKGFTLHTNLVSSNRSTYLQDTVGLAYNWDGTVRQVIEFGERVPLKTSGGGQQGEKLMNRTDRHILNGRTNFAYRLWDNHKVSLNHKFETLNRNDHDLLNAARQSLAVESKISKHIYSLSYEASLLKQKLIINALSKYTTHRTQQRSPSIKNNSIVYTDKNSFDSNFGYGATLSYQLIQKLFLIASTENSSIMPEDAHLYGSPEINILPNPSIRPEQNINYNLGFRWTGIGQNKHRFSLMANLFWRNGFDKITQQAVDASEIKDETDADIQTTRYVNLGRTQAKGFEAELTYDYGRKLFTTLNFSKFNNLFKERLDEVGNTHKLYDLQVPNEPFFTINSMLSYRFKNSLTKHDNLSVNYGLGFVGEYYTVWGQPQFSKTPSQVVHDIGFSYQFPNKKWVLSADAKNLFNAEVYDNFMVQKPGRSIFLKLNYSINKF